MGLLSYRKAGAGRQGGEKAGRLGSWEGELNSEVGMWKSEREKMEVGKVGRLIEFGSGNAEVGKKKVGRWKRKKVRRWDGEKMRKGRKVGGWEAEKVRSWEDGRLRS
jgi:hypothetical protein